MCDDSPCAARIARLAVLDQDYADINRLVEYHTNETRRHLAGGCCDRMVVWSCASRMLLECIEEIGVGPDTVADVLACAILKLAERPATSQASDI